MPTLLAIISHPKDNALVARHWPFFKMTKWDIVGFGTDDGKCEWPEHIPRVDNGKMGTRQTPCGSSIWGLVEQELEIWKYFLDSDYDSVCVVEADNLFTRQPPNHPGGTYLVTLLPNMSPPGLFKTSTYFSTPRWADRGIARRLYDHGLEMYQLGDHEHWISDRFPALVCYRHQIPFMAQPAWSPSVFVANDGEWIRDARAAIGMGGYCLHSVKHEWQLEAVRDLIQCP